MIIIYLKICSITFVSREFSPFQENTPSRNLRNKFFFYKSEFSENNSLIFRPMKCSIYDLRGKLTTSVVTAVAV